MCAWLCVCVCVCVCVYACVCVWVMEDSVCVGIRSCQNIRRGSKPTRSGDDPLSVFPLPSRTFPTVTTTGGGRRLAEGGVGERVEVEVLLGNA